MKKIFKEIFYNQNSRKFELTNDFLAFVTIISVLAISFETVKSLSEYKNIFYIIEILSTFIFSVEYIGRIIGEKNPLKYIFSFFGIIDILAIVPTLFGLGNLTFLKSARLFRILRFLRILKMVKITNFKKSHKKEKLDPEENFIKINLEIYLVVLVISLFFSAAAIWFVEGNREIFSSIPASMLWSMKVLLGGAAQALPNTIWGEIIMIITRFIGLVLFALLINLVAKVSKKFFLNNNK